MDDQDTQSEPVAETPLPEPVSAPDPESPTSDSASIPVESDNSGLNQQPQSPTQQDQAGFIHMLLAKANAKIRSNKQKKLELLMQAVSKKGTIDNHEAQKILRISDKTAERYLNKLVAQGRLKRAGAGRDVIYKLPS